MPLGHWGKCIRCSSDMWMPQAFYEAAYAGRPRISFYCSYGHPQVFSEGESQETLLRRERDRLKQSVAQLEDSVRHWVGEKQAVEKKLALAVKSKARTIKRIHAGVCPHCNRTFADMARHMASKHKEAAE